jgi:hypothetical protein
MIVNNTLRPLRESQRDSDTQPRVARNELPWMRRPRERSTLKGLRPFPEAARFAEAPARMGATLSGEWRLHKT